jgi:TolB-like protein/DNA-binding winged helix-turn-helix (wHTH) protein
MYRFEGYTLDIARCSLRVADREVELRPKSLDVLRHLIENADRIVTKEELLKAVWPHVIVTDDSLTRCISEAREALGDSGHTLIKTVLRRGYRFTAAVSGLPTDSTCKLPPSSPGVMRVITSEAVPRDTPSFYDGPSIAVLPFDNLSGDPQQDYFGDGLVEEIITALSRIGWLFVSARSSSFTYKGRAVDVKQVGRELGVHYVLEGSVRKAANRVRITCQLIDASNGMHIWADRYDSAIEDAFDLQDRVTANLVSAIARQLQRAVIDRAKCKPAQNLTSRDYFLRGMRSFYCLSAEASNDALQHFNKAIALDPEFAAAYGMAAWCYGWRKTYRWMIDPAQEQVDGVRLARCAIELGRDDGVALGCGGWALGYLGGDSEAGADFVDRARALNPHFAANWYLSGWLRLFLGDLESAITDFAQVLCLSHSDPLLVHTKNGIAFTHFLTGRHDEALPWAEAALRENPHHKPALRVSAAIKARLGMKDEARTAIARMGQLDPAFRLCDVSKVAPFRRSVDLEKFQDNLRKAGLPE